MVNRFEIPDQPMVNFDYFKQFHKVPEKLSNIIEFCIDSFSGGHSNHRYLTETEARARQTVLTERVKVVNKQVKEPKKRYYIETIQFCDGMYPKIYDIQPDGSYVYNAWLSRYALNRSHDVWFIHQLFSQAIMA